MSTKTFNLSLPKELLDKIDAQAKKEFTSRSEYLRRLAVQDLQRQAAWDDLFERANAKGRAMGITSEQQVYDIIAEYKREKNAQRD